MLKFEKSPQEVQFYSFAITDREERAFGYGSIVYDKLVYFECKIEKEISECKNNVSRSRGATQITPRQKQ